MNLILAALGLYLLAGAIFAIFFLARGLSRIDPSATRSPWTFRALILPGVAALWPYLALTWSRTARRDGRA